MVGLRIFIVSFLSVFSSLLCADEGSFEENYQFKGVHFLASYSECDQGALTDLEGLIQAMHAAVEECGATVLSSTHHVFPPYGLTMVFLLSESHASIHTYPEHGACFVDLFTCGVKCSATQFDAILRDYLKPKTISQRVLVREKAISDQCTLE